MPLVFPDKPSYLVLTNGKVRTFHLLGNETFEKALKRLDIKDVELIWEPLSWATDTITNQHFRI